jgi:hypothetical protein
MTTEPYGITTNLRYKGDLVASPLSAPTVFGTRSDGLGFGIQFYLSEVGPAVNLFIRQPWWSTDLYSQVYSGPFPGDGSDGGIALSILQNEPFPGPNTPETQFNNQVWPGATKWPNANGVANTLGWPAIWAGGTVIGADGQTYTGEYAGEYLLTWYFQNAPTVDVQNSTGWWRINYLFGNVLQGLLNQYVVPVALTTAPAEVPNMPPNDVLYPPNTVGTLPTCWSIAYAALSLAKFTTAGTVVTISSMVVPTT